ncbi:four helix bundle protein [Treponema sp.]|uniref:four helix bundle protein n=1 Tax=Treponema sp. TaxID=166 RepID=UPI003FA32568
MNVIVDKSKSFALTIINAHKILCSKHEFILSQQLLRSGTSIGSKVKEAVSGQTKADFYAKLLIAFKDANETEYWLELLYESGYLQKSDFAGMYADCQEILKILAAIVKHRK